MGKLKKTGRIANKISKSIPVEDSEGNKHILKATVISISKGGSNSIAEDNFEQLILSNKLVSPPLSQTELSVLAEVSSELGQVIDSLSVGIDGFGSRLIRRKKLPVIIDPSSDDAKELAEDKVLAAEAVEEKSFLDAMMMFPNPDEDFTELKKNTRQELEATGNAYWELIPTPVAGSNKLFRYSCINRLSPSTMFFTKPDKKMTRMKLHYVDARLNLRSKTFMKRFRRLVQVIGTKSVYFKQFGDPRVIDKRDGSVIAPSIEFWSNDLKLQNEFPKKYWANEVYHHKIPTPRRTPYGLPRYTGNIIAIKGSRGADETNILTQQNNHMPSMAIVVAGGMLTEGSVQRIQEFVDTQIKGNANYSKFLILEGESTHDSLSGAASMKVEVKPLSDNQHKDQLWQDYDKNNASKIRRNFRTPPIMVGHIDDLTRANAQESERFAEKWVYNPARESMDKAINKILMQQGFKHWVFKSNSPNVTNDEDLVAILTGGEKTGGITPRIARMLLEDILNRELPAIKEDNPDFDPDVPFSLSIAKLAMGAKAASANQSGTFSTQGQNQRPRNPVGRPSNEDSQKHMELVDELFDNLDGSKILERLTKNPQESLEALQFLRDSIEDSMDLSAFGEVKRGYFDHEH